MKKGLGQVEFRPRVKACQVCLLLAWHEQLLASARGSGARSGLEELDQVGFRG
jgi:hypothetical protein